MIVLIEQKRSSSVEEINERTNTTPSIASSDEFIYMDNDHVDPLSHQQNNDTYLNNNISTPALLARRDEACLLNDQLILEQVESMALTSTHDGEIVGDDGTMIRSRSHYSEVADEFDEATNPVHIKAAIYEPPQNPSTSLAVFIKKIHQSSFIVRYFAYIFPVSVLLLIPLLVGALGYHHNVSVGGVELMWFAIWLEIVWLTLWAGRIVAKCLPPVVGMLATIFTMNPKKWRDMAKQLELHATLFFWWLGVEVSFLPTMTNHHLGGNKATYGWERTVNKLIIVAFVWTILNLIEKIIIQLIAISFHMRTYSDRIEIHKFQVGSLGKLYDWTRNQIPETDETTGEERTIVAGAATSDSTGRRRTQRSDPYRIVVTLLRSTTGRQVLARRLYHCFVHEGSETIFPDDIKRAFDNGDEAEAAFSMFDRDLNGEISMEELISVCTEIASEGKSITASLKDIDSVVSKLDSIFMFFIFVVVLMVFLSLISTSAAGVLTSAASGILGFSWMFSTTAQEFLQSIIFVFVKHPFDIGDRVTIYGRAGDTNQGDDYFVKEITLWYTEFKKMQGHVVQAPNSYLNTLFILNQRRSGPIAEAVPVIIKYGTTIDQIDLLRQRLLEFVLTEKRDFKGNILTELRQVTENYSLTLNVVFFYKSNWQNEGLRLQRRNKFISMLMVTLQEIGIEGPRMNLQGYSAGTPIYLWHSAP